MGIMCSYGSVAHGTRNACLHVMFTIRLIVKVRGTRRTIREFVRAEYALNVSSHAYRYTTRDEADAAADLVADRFREAGHTVIGSDLFEVQS